MAHTRCLSHLLIPRIGALSKGHAKTTVLVTGALFATMLHAVTIPSLAAAVKGKKATYVFDANSGRALHSDRAYEPRYPASLTKMMTLYLVFELIEQRKLSYATRIYASKRAAAQPPSRIGLKRGEHLTVLQAVKALITKSANDVATAIAEHISGTEPKFARLMTAEARKLGMKNTTFRNASGLPNANQVTTAADMAILALQLQDHFPEHYKHFSLRSFKHKGRKYRNHNALLGRYPGIDGIKTGYTRASGFNLVTSLRHKGRHVIAVVLGGRTGRARNARMRQLLDRHITSAAKTKTRRPTVRLALRALPRQAKRFARPAHAATTDATIAEAKARPNRTVRRSSRTHADPQAPRPQYSASIDRDGTGPNIRVARVRHVDLRFPPLSATKRHNRTAQRSRHSPSEQIPAQDEYRRAKPLSDQAFGGGTYYKSYEAKQAHSPQSRRTAYADQTPQLARSNGNYHIQVGAYSSAVEARRRLANVTAQTSPLLKEVRAIAMSVASGGRNLFRARYVGLTSRAARSACRIMRQQRIDCFVIAASN